MFHKKFHTLSPKSAPNFKPSQLCEDLMDLLNSLFNLHQIIHSFLNLI